MSWLSLVGLAFKAWSWLTGWQERLQGRKEQREADDSASIEIAEKARKDEDGLKSLPDDDLDQRLRDSLP